MVALTAIQTVLPFPILTVTLSSSSNTLPDTNRRDRQKPIPFIWSIYQLFLFSSVRNYCRVLKPVASIAICSGHILPWLVLIMACKTICQSAFIREFGMFTHPLCIMACRPFEVTSIAVTVGSGKISNFITG